MTIEAFWYDNQLKRYINQFMAVFRDLQVSTGKRANRDSALITVPTIVAPRDRVAAAAATGHTQNNHMRVPIMSVDLSSIEYAPDRAKGTNLETREVFVPYGGTIQQDAQTVYTRIATPYKLKMELAIYVSNKDHLFQILEQILPLFDPTLQLQTSDGPLDKTRISTIELLDISNEETFPPGTNSSTMVTILTFQIDAWLTVPSEVKKNLVHKVIARISAMDGDIQGLGDLGSIYDQDNVEKIILQKVPEEFK